MCDVYGPGPGQRFLGRGRLVLWLAWALVCLGVMSACSEDADAPQPDTMREEPAPVVPVTLPPVDDDPPVMPVDPSCSLELRAPASVGEGDVLEVVAAVEGSVEEGASLAWSSPEGWERWEEVAPRDGESIVRWRAPYREGDAEAFEVELDCAQGGKVQVSLQVAITPLRWQQLPRIGDAMPPREHPHVWIPEDAPESMYVFGGFLFEPAQFTPGYDLWRYDFASGAWQELSQEGDVPPFAGGRHTIVEGSLVLFGGDVPREGRASEALYRLELEGAVGRWSPPAPSSLSRSLGGFVYDAPRERFVSFCGLGPGPASAMDCAPRVRSANAEAWEVVAVEPGRVPSDRYGFFRGHDTERERVIVFSGGGRGTQADPVNPRADAWVLDLSQELPTWSRLETSGPRVQGRRNGCGAWDQQGQRLFVWGGTPDARSTVTGLQVLHLSADGRRGRWHEIDVPGSPEERSSCLSVFDASRGRMIVGYGNNSQAIYEDLWALSLR